MDARCFPANVRIAVLLMQRFLISRPSPRSADSCQAWTDFAAMESNTIRARLAETQQSVFETLGWFKNLAATCPVAGAQVLLLGVDEPDGATMLALRRWRGGKLESLSNYYGSLFGPVTTDAESAAGHATHFARWLAAYGCSTLRLHPLSHDASFWDSLSAGLVQHGYWVDQYFTFGNWFHPCADVRWKEYLAARPSRLRNTITRTQKKLFADPEFSFQISSASTAKPQLDQLISDFCAVYARSWKKPEPYPSFIPGLCHLAHAQGWLRLGVGYLNGTPAAAQIWIVKSGVASIFKLAYDHNFAKHGVGTLMSALLTKHVLDVDQVEEIDFLAGDDSYKSEWMDCRRERFGIVAFQPKTLRGLAAGCLHFGARIMRRIAPSRNTARTNTTGA